MKILDYKSSTFANDLKVACEPVALSSNIPSAVADVIAQVRAKGDSAVFAFTKKFDGVDISKDTLKVSDAEFKLAQKKVSSADKKAMREAIACVKQYNLRSKPKNWRAKIRTGQLSAKVFTQ